MSGVLEAFELADRLLLVTSYNLSAVRGTKATLLMLEALGIDLDRVDVVLNHTRPRTNYRREDIEEILGRRILVDLPYDPRVDPSLDPGRRSSWRNRAPSFRGGSARWPSWSRRPPAPSRPAPSTSPRPKPRHTGADSAWAGGKVAP